MHTQGDCPPDEPFCTHTALRQLQLYQINANEANARVPRFDHCLRRKRLRASQRCRSGASRDHVNAVALRCCAHAAREQRSAQHQEAAKRRPWFRRRAAA
eukprot:2569316-Prymnesium_polylepis.1